MSGKYGEPWFRNGDARYRAVVSATYGPHHFCCSHGENDPRSRECFEAYRGWLLFESATPEVAERIMLCVNALAGVSNDTLREHIKRGGYAEAVPA